MSPLGTIRILRCQGAGPIAVHNDSQGRVEQIGRRWRRSTGGSPCTLGESWHFNRSDCRAGRTSVAPPRQSSRSAGDCDDRTGGTAIWHSVGGATREPSSRRQIRTGPQNGSTVDTAEPRLNGRSSLQLQKVLLQRNLVTEHQIEQVLATDLPPGADIGEALVSMGFSMT